MSNDFRPPCHAYLDRATQDRIGRELRAVFTEPLQEPLPDNLLGALRAIQNAERDVNRSRQIAGLNAISFGRNATELAELAV